MAPCLSTVCTLLCLGTSAAFVAPPSSRLSTGITAHRTSRAAVTGAALGGRQPRGLPLSMAAAGDDAVDQEILKKVQDIVVSQLSVEPSQVLPEASFTQDLGADSLDTVELIMALEEGFDIEIEDEVAAEIGTVKDAVNFIAKSA
ncbi:unnamed protein product [Scytosiphon promiscuus]